MPVSKKAPKGYRKLAAAVAASRPDFERIYDDLRRLRQDPKTVPFKVAALGARTNEDAFLAALEQAAKGGWLSELVSALVRAEAFAMPDHTGAMSVPEEVRVELQGIVRVDLGFLRP